MTNQIEPEPKLRYFVAKFRMSEPASSAADALWEALITAEREGIELMEVGPQGGGVPIRLEMRAVEPERRLGEMMRD
ncbi:hypothetical protein SAMN05443247_06529 [Bradyrhizobium erythrophlei]|nr:hypothetical protein SAMN05443247_06529 [Bradyrhizobium erythrophlei]